MNVMNAVPALDRPAPSVIRLPRLRKRLLILGAGQQAKELGQVLVAQRDSRYKVILAPQQNGRVTVIKDLPRPICLAVMSRLDLFARCTYYDGDAISVSES